MPSYAATDCTVFANDCTSLWVDWNSTSASSSNAITSTTWSGWHNVDSTTSTVWYVWTDEAWREYAATGHVPAQVAAPNEAAEKAEKILTENLTEEQKAQLARDRFFVVRGSKGRNYRVNRGRARNIEVLDENGKAVERLCAHPGIHCPDADTMLAQKLMLETDEDAFQRIANRSAA